MAVEAETLPISIVATVDAGPTRSLLLLFSVLSSVVESWSLGVSLELSVEDANSASVAVGAVVVVVVVVVELEDGLSDAIGSSLDVVVVVIGVGVVVVEVVVVAIVVGCSVCSVVSVSVLAPELLVVDSSPETVVVGGDTVVSAEVSWAARVVSRLDSYEELSWSSFGFEKLADMVTGSKGLFATARASESLARSLEPTWSMGIRL